MSYRFIRKFISTGFYGLVTTRAAKDECGLDGVVIPSTEFRYSDCGKELEEYLNSLAVCNKVFVAHHCDSLSEMTHIGPMAGLNVNVFGYYTGGIILQSKAFWHLDIEKGWFKAVHFANVDELKKFLEGKI